ncbi:MAG: tetratricopeptide repeat protein [Azoarcus sp.]|jgi:tetratricopeptide (TPR) repeat protein|nr:tetratricopeptide repeat protein [Azoarcus sp.]
MTRYRALIACLLVVMWAASCTWLREEGGAPAESFAVEMDRLETAGGYLREQGRFEEAAAVYDEIDRRFGRDPSPAVRERVAAALNAKALTRRDEGRHEEAFAILTEIDRRYGAAADPSARFEVVLALGHKSEMLDSLGRYDEANAVSREVVRRFARDNYGIRQAAMDALIERVWRLRSNKRSEDEIAILAWLSEGFGAAADVASRRKIARALVDRGEALARLGRFGEAIAVYEDAARRYGAETDRRLLGEAVRALVDKGEALGQQGRYEKELALYVDIERRHGTNVGERDSEWVDPLDWEVSRARVNAVTSLLMLGRNREALRQVKVASSRYDVGNGVLPFLVWLADSRTPFETVRRRARALDFDDHHWLFRWSADVIRPLLDRLPEPRRTQARCLAAFYEAHHDRETLDDCLGGAARVGASETAAAEAVSLDELGRRALLLLHRGKQEESAAVFDEIECRFGQDEEAAIRTRFAEMLFGRARYRSDKEPPEEAIAAFDDIVRRFADDPVGMARFQALFALSGKMEKLVSLNRFDEADAAHAELVRRFAQDEDDTVRVSAANNLYNYAWALKVKGRFGEALAVYGEIDRLFSGDGANMAPVFVADALVGRGDILALQGRFEEAITAYDEAERRLVGKTAPRLHGKAAEAFVSKAAMWGQLGQPERELALYAEAEERYPAGEDGFYLKEEVARARVYALPPMLALGRAEEAILRAKAIQTDAESHYAAFMPFVLWLTDASAQPGPVRDAVREFGDIGLFLLRWPSGFRPVIASLPEPRQTQALCFVAYLGRHHDIRKLDACLGYEPER